MLRDFRFALHLIAKDKWYSAVAVIALALGIGVNATVFTLVNAVLIRGLPFKDSGKLYMLGSLRASAPPGSGGGGISYADYQDLRGQQRSFVDLALFTQNSFNISDEHGMPEQARGALVTAETFRLLGQPAMLGRDFAPSDDRKGAELTVLLGYTLWKNRYGSDAGVIGRPIRVNGRPGTIIGVMPDKMKFPTNAEMWTPFVPSVEQEKRNNRFFSVFGRLKDGTSRAQAQAEVNGIAGGLAAQYPDTNKEYTRILVETFNDRFNGGPIRAVFLSMMGAVGFVLLIACANVANLLLSRSAHRSREIAVRIALGATRWRVIRQLLVESVVLGFIGGALGFLLALVGIRLFDAAVADVGKPYWIAFTIDYVVLGFLAAICVLTGVLFGLAPALQVSKTNVNEVLKEGGRGNAGGRRARWLSSTMVVVELALTIVLLVGAGLMIRSFLKLYALDIGIDTRNLMTMRMQLQTDSKYNTPEQRRAFYEQLVPKLAAIPGVESVAITTSVPPQGSGSRGFEIEGRPARKPGEDPPQIASVIISPEFFQTVGVAVRRGRAFTASDGLPGNENIIINERVATRFFASEDPIGHRIRFVSRDPPPAGQPAPVWRTIVGVCPTMRHSQPQDGEPTAAVYLPHRQDPPGGAALLVRSHLEPGKIMTEVRRTVQSLDQDQPVFTIQTLDQILMQMQWPFRVFGSLFAIFAVIALSLSSVGLYAVMAYSVTQRTQEIGVRMALGADSRQVSWLILRRGLIQIVVGVSLGLVGAFFMSQAIGSVLVQITARDPATFAGITILLTLVAIAACLIPARRATRVDPLIALRAE
jgi:putative ABC transport system permease protein